VSVLYAAYICVPIWFLVCVIVADRGVIFICLARAVLEARPANSVSLVSYAECRVRRQFVVCSRVLWA